MEMWGESRFGLDNRDLIESALARPRHAARYENADLVRQAATLVFGLIKNHPWTGGNKRTASFLMDEFLFRNQIELTAAPNELTQMCLRVEANEWLVDEIESWLRPRIRHLR
jgi:death-on-curing protein